jgi:Uma2 family endonuclease
MDAQAKTRVTFEEYDALPETNQIVELIEGEFVANPPNFRHQKTLLQIIAVLLPLDLEGELCIAPVGLHFDDGNSFEPDLFWVSPHNTACALEPAGRYWHGAPDLVIEILSPSTALNDRGVKFDTYEKYGVREYWLVDPEAKFTEVYRHDGSRFARVGLFKPGQPFESAALGGAAINTEMWFAAREGGKDG